MRQCVITVGGIGTRLRSVTGSVPKPLWEIDSRSVLERTIQLFSDGGFSEFVLLSGYKSNLIREAAENIARRISCRIRVIVEDYPLGEAGGLALAKEFLEKEFAFVNGDLVCEFDVQRCVKRFREANADLLVLTHLTDHPEDSDCVREDKTCGIVGYKFKEEVDTSEFYYLGNAGIAFVRLSAIIDIINSWRYGEKYSFFKDVTAVMVGRKGKVKSYNTTEYIKDMGTPRRLTLSETHVASGLAKKKSYRYSQNALFLDRDGTLIDLSEGGYITRIEEVKIREENVEKIASLRREYDQCHIVTNQPQVAMGLCTYEESRRITEEVIRLCLKRGLEIDSFYMCPHHEDSGYDGEREDLKTKCFCRKPSPGMIYQASFERNIDISSSLVIGDSGRDRELATYLEMNFLHVDSL